MSLRKKFMKLPLWKAIILVLLAASIFMAGIEHLFFGKLFSVIDNTITRFDLMFKQDDAEYDADWKKREEIDKKERAEKADENKKENERWRQFIIKDQCKTIKEIRAIDQYDATHKKSKEDKFLDKVYSDDWYRNTSKRAELLKSSKEMLAEQKASEKDCDGIEE